LKLRIRVLIVVLLAMIVVGSCSYFGFMSEDDMLSPAAFEGNSALETTELEQSGNPDEYDYSFAGYQSEPNIPPRHMRGVWVTSVINLDFPSSQGISADAMRREIRDTVARTADIGLNTIIFQVRPTGDAFYESDVFPWSHWLSGTQGEAIPGFDPLQYWIDVSHANDIELHAWINPYRIIHTIQNSSDPNSLYENHPVRLNPELAVAWTDPSNGRSGLFLDPGRPEAKQLILDGIESLIRRYNVDGIHFDDYFYPDTNFDDSASFARYGGGMNLHDWRRENVNTLIREIQKLIDDLNEELGRNVVWGISPTAIWKNASTDPLGIPTTRGQESFHALYADTRLWVTEGWVDYIMPQIYWYIGFEIANFEAVLDWWIDLCKDRDVDLIVGLAAWREEDDHQAPRWRGEMVRQLEMLAQSDVVKGEVFFRSNHLRGAVGDSIREFYLQQDHTPPYREPVIILDTLSVGTPANNASITAPNAERRGFNITGTSSPDEHLFMNGAVVRNRTVEGFFSVHVPLEPGENSFTFTQQGQEPVTRTITRNAPAAPTSSTPAPAVTITTVTEPTYATVTSNAAWVFPRNTATGGSDWMLNVGQIDRVVAESTNNFFRLSSGRWISGNHVSISNRNSSLENVLRNGTYRVGEHYDVLVWQSDVSPAVYAQFDGHVLRIYYGLHTEAPPLTMPPNLSDTLFQSFEYGMDGDTPFHAFTLRNNAYLEGQYVKYSDGEFRIYLKKRRALAEGNRPLAGFEIVLDAGHGGTEPGAIGPMGMDMPEMELTLINAKNLYERLTSLGASVHMTRTGDYSVSLQDRVDISRQVKPDLFISLHVNSVAETTNATNIRGFTVWYRNPGSAPFARTVLDVMYDINPGTNRYRNINQANFFVCRPQWAPHVIFESSFIVNIDDFVWLIDTEQQAGMADASVEAILEYFS